MRIVARALWAGILISGVAASGRAEVPPPSKTPARVVVNGRTSTAVDVEIVKVGQELPRTYSAPACKSIPGYDWYVSQHFALRSEVSEEQSRELLLFAELAYPHFVWIFGREPPGIETTRIAFSYSKDLDSLKRASDVDVGGVGWRGGGGGVTLAGSGLSYNYPSGGLKSHRRGLMMHENLHAFQFAVTGHSSFHTPVRFYEGITYSLEQHVYDPSKRQLTVQVFDRASGNIYHDTALSRQREDFVSARDLWKGKEGLGYRPDLYSLWMHFLFADTDRRMRHRVWLDELLHRDPDVTLEEKDAELMEDLFAPTNELDRAFADWIAKRRNSFTYVDWGFEQEGDTLWSYGWPNWALNAQLNVNLLLEDPPGDDPYVLDWPVYQSKPPIVGTVARGVDEPSVGAVLDFSRRRDAKGRAGLGFGVGGTGQRPDGKSNEFQEYLGVFVRGVGGESPSVAIGGLEGAGETSEALPAALSRAMRENGQRLGLTCRVARDAFQVTLRAGEDGRIEAFTASVPIDEAARRRLLAKPWAVMSKDNYHGVTLYPDVERGETNDPSRPAPAGRDRFLAEQETYRLYRAAWRLGSGAPESLTALRDLLLASARKDVAAQAAALKTYHERLPALVQDLEACGDEAARIGKTLGE